MAHIRAVMLSIVLVSGMLLLNIGVEEAFAKKGGQGKSQGDPQSCDNDNKGKAKGQNPNCIGNGPDCTDAGGDSDGDKICDADDICPNNPVGPLGQIDTDFDGDGEPNTTDADRCDASIQ